MKKIDEMPAVQINLDKDDLFACLDALIDSLKQNCVRISELRYSDEVEESKKPQQMSSIADGSYFLCLTARHLSEALQMVVGDELAKGIWKSENSNAR